jgi:hypothetical protein
MKSSDVIELFDYVGVNAQVFVTPKPLPRALAQVDGEQSIGDQKANKRQL